MKTNFKKFLGVTLATATLGLSLTSIASAREVGNYNTTVGSFNGSGYTGGLKKETSNRDGIVNSSSVGGGYKVDARLQKTDGKQSGSWARSIGNGDRVTLGNSIGSGLSTRVQFSNNITTPVNVQVSGSWSPDNK
ncbi:hypothetical protein [Bacillus cereus group sp. BfR-BA-01379]|uniref:hypothetical protein n=1 Tax=Bacillus cereus group sp. BfR-BA-01379 TaxID=2920323 RepID=UPI001F580C12|nr:hypothetical protein [Bacillus cereus group sp. BfR-BA-01379]